MLRYVCGFCEPSVSVLVLWTFTIKGTINTRLSIPFPLRANVRFGILYCFMHYLETSVKNKHLFIQSGRVNGMPGACSTSNVSGPSNPQPCFLTLTFERGIWVKLLIIEARNDNHHLQSSLSHSFNSF